MTASMAALAARALPFSIAGTGAIACGLTFRADGFSSVASWSMLAALIAWTMRASSTRFGATPMRISAAGTAAWLIAANVVVWLLLIPVVVLISPNAADAIRYWTYPYENKRWLIALYGLTLAGLFVLPAAAYRLLAGGRAEAAAEVPATRRRRLDRLAGSAIVLALATLIAGPPWNVERHHRGIDFHEQVHLGPLQAIDKGVMPFVGPAATQYGPGSQVLTYRFMKATGRFNLVGYRQANLMFHYAAMAATVLIALWLIDLPGALLVMVLALAFSPLGFFSVAPDGTFAGNYGWGNAWRYLGALIVVPAATMAMLRMGERRISIAHVGFGILWGFFSWLSQENLSSTLTAGGLAVVLLVLTNTIGVRHAAAAAVSLLAGFFMFWLPLLGVYAWQGLAGEFVSNYFRVAGAVAVGFSNSWWTDIVGTPEYRAYRATILVIAGAGVLTLWDLRSLRLRQPLESAQVRLLAFVAVLAAAYTTTLYRSDNSHLVNTLLPMPFVAVLAFRDLPSWNAAGWLQIAAVRAVVVTGVLYVYPMTAVLMDLPNWVIGPAAARYRPTTPVETLPAAGGGVAFERATALLSDEPAAMPGGVPMRQFLEEASELNRLIGTRTTYVTGLHTVYTGLVYFMADLTPYKGLIERETMTINPLYEAEVLEVYRRSATEIHAVLVRDLEMAEAKIFLDAHPGARVEQRPLAGRPVFVLLANP